MRAIPNGIEFSWVLGVNRVVRFVVTVSDADGSRLDSYVIIDDADENFADGYSSSGVA
jgi:hypothetical protein